VKYYSKAKIFWSAVGYGANPEKEPHKVEHFGMSVVEGMSAGCVPIVIEKGGHKETVRNGENGFLWNSVSELQELTQSIASDERRRKQIAEQAEKDSQKFSIETFEKSISKIFK
jgi:glycosyltransferase involved in cell wall biosynthesis